MERTMSLGVGGGLGVRRLACALKAAASRRSPSHVFILTTATHNTEQSRSVAFSAPHRYKASLVSERTQRTLRLCCESPSKN